MIFLRRLYGLPLIALSIFFFLYITGFNTNFINPRNIDWIFFFGNTDSTTAWFGWEYFRWTNFIQFPLITNYPYGEELNISLIYSGSIPIICLLLKPFEQFLGFPFQFLGAWHLLCVYLQGYFSLKILDLFIDSIPVKLLFVSIILLLPILPLNVLLNHPGLFANWIIIASLYFYLKNKFSYQRWFILLSIALLTQAYLFAMILPIFFADLVQRFLSNQMSFHKLLLLIASLCLLLISLFILSGIETGKDTYHFYQGYGHYRLNLNSLLDPSVNLPIPGNEIYNFSTILPNLNDTTNIQGSGDYEGFNFVGIPILTILIISFLNYKKNLLNFSKKNYLPILTIAILLFMFALSNKVILNDSLLINYPLPSFIKNFFATFRSSGRFFWPVLYIISFLSFFTFYKLFSVDKCKIILPILLLIGFMDSFEAYSKTRLTKSQTLDYNGPTWKYKLQDENWDYFGKNYSKLKFIYPEVMPNSNTAKLNLFAVSNGLSTNGGYLSRVKKTALEDVKKSLRESINSCDFDSQSLYIFSSKEVWEKASKCDNKNTSLYIDGVYIIAPKN